jgi:hypothetical protein
VAKKKKKQPEITVVNEAELVSELTCVMVALLKGAAPHIDEEQAYETLEPFVSRGFEDLGEAIAVGEHIASGDEGTLQ